MHGAGSWAIFSGRNTMKNFDRPMRRNLYGKHRNSSLWRFYFILDKIHKIVILRDGSCKMPSHAGIAQLVERHVANVNAAGSSPVSRSIGGVAKRLRRRSAKPLYSGSNPLAASKNPRAGMAELVDARDLKSLVPRGACRFDSGSRYSRTGIGD